MNQIWSNVGKLLGGLLLFWGGAVTLGMLVGIAASHAAGILLAILATLLVFFGLAPAVLGGWILYISAKAEQRVIRDRFFQLLRLNQGRLSLLDFTTATRMEPAIARRHLNSWAKEFDASFEVSETGDIYYIFFKNRLSETI